MHYYNVSILKFLPACFVNLDVVFLILIFLTDDLLFDCYKIINKGLWLGSIYLLVFTYETLDREVFKTFLGLCLLSPWWCFCKCASNFKFVVRFCVHSVFSWLFRVWNNTVEHSECFLSVWIDVLILLSIILIVTEIWTTNSASNFLSAGIFC